MYLPVLSETKYIFFSASEYLPKMFYYTHFPGIIISLIMSFYVYLKAQKSLATKNFFLICIFFSAWVLSDIIAWTNPSSDLQMYVWRFYSLLSFSIVFFSYYFFISITHTGVNYKITLLIASFYLPLLYFALTEKGADIMMVPYAGANETSGYLIFTYGIELGLIGYIFYLAIRKIISTKGQERKIILILSAGLFFLLIPFILFSAIDSYKAFNGMTNVFDLEAHGLLGMNVFMACIAYLIVKYQFFGIRWKANRVLLFALLAIVVSQVFFVSTTFDRIFVAISSLAAVIMGYLLIKVIRSEEETKIQELERVNVELQKLDKTKSEFINIASHQLRTPLTIVKGVASLLVSGKIERFSQEDKKQFYGSVWSKCLKLENIIDDILNAATFTNKKYSVMNQCAQNVNVKQLLEKIVTDFSQEIQEKKLKVSIIDQTSERNEVWAQKEYLEEAFVNLLSNAIKYTPAASAGNEGDISFRLLSRDTKHLIVKIQDSGIGIAEQEIPKLFGRFFRAENARRLYTDGTGLGLFIVKEIIEGHGGRIAVVSQLDKGTTFIIQLPLNASVEPDIRKHLINQAILSNNIKQ